MFNAHRPWALIPIVVVCLSGCGSTSSGPILPNGSLTPEQQAKVRAEDKQIEDEESQGSAGKQQ